MEKHGTGAGADQGRDEGPVDSAIIHHGGSGGVPTTHMSPIEDDQGGHGARADGKRSINYQRSASMIANLRAQNQRRRAMESLKRRLEVLEQDGGMSPLEALVRLSHEHEVDRIGRYNLLRDRFIKQRRRNRSLEEVMGTPHQWAIRLQTDMAPVQFISGTRGGNEVANQGLGSGNYELVRQDSTAASQDTVSPGGIRGNRRRSASCP